MLNGAKKKEENPGNLLKLPCLLCAKIKSYKSTKLPELQVFDIKRKQKGLKAFQSRNK